MLLHKLLVGGGVVNAADLPQTTTLDFKMHYMQHVNTVPVELLRGIYIMWSRSFRDTRVY